MSLARPRIIIPVVVVTLGLLGALGWFMVTGAAAYGVWNPIVLADIVRYNRTVDPIRAELMGADAPSPSPGVPLDSEAAQQLALTRLEAQHQRFEPALAAWRAHVEGGRFREHWIQFGKELELGSAYWQLRVELTRLHGDRIAEVPGASCRQATAFSAYMTQVARAGDAFSRAAGSTRLGSVQTAVSGERARVAACAAQPSG